MPPPIRPTSQPPTYTESQQTYLHEPLFIVLAPVRRNPEASQRRRDPPVHDISAGDRFVALADIGIRKAIKALKPGSDKKPAVKEGGNAKSS
ncbi:hypothetical protein D9756_007506 [Leucocoprinus leucothites]|uniref:Uncharacterized protein n=1 Tax=Leucocoprinus leucothites TaxID=201217 RepID=A0A8H5D0Z0_9AGAR|nr:hypothetical protein D9756_007506 [Leucoagaricus leucothites]